MLEWSVYDMNDIIIPKKAAFFCRMVTGQSLWARRSCFNCATSFLKRVTSLCWQQKMHKWLQARTIFVCKSDYCTCKLLMRQRPETLTVRETFMLARSSAFFSKELTHSFRFCLQRDAAARFLSKKRCLRSSGSISEARRRRPPVGWAGDTFGNWNWKEQRSHI